MTIATPIRSLYVHVPFCQTICGYCDFYSTVLERGSVEPLVSALLTELGRLADAYELRLQTIFVGGGTPTTLPAPELRRLLSALHGHAWAGDNLEFTVEANPATVTSDIAAALVESGVNRVSIGAQSFDRSELRVLDRIHAPPQVEETVQICRSSGVDNLNLDLIFAVPGQTLARWGRNLDEALALKPDHLSCYGLTFERGTPLFKQLEAGVVQRLDTDLEAAMYEATVDRLAAAGLHQYEISNYARPGRECRHNLVYWRNEPCLALGPSAAGFDGRVRYRNIPDTAAYVAAVREGRSPWIEQEELPNDRRARETAMLELRLNAGIRAERFRARFGHDPKAVFAAAIEKLAPLGLLVSDTDGVRLTRAGRLVADSVISEFL